MNAIEPNKIKPSAFSAETFQLIIGTLAIALGPFLILVNMVVSDCSGVQMSISEYYHTRMGDVFVGFLFAVGFLMLGYSGYNEMHRKWYQRDRLFSLVAGLCAIGVATFPTELSANAPCDIVYEPYAKFATSLHYIFAGILFSILGYFSIYLFRLGHIDKLKCSAALDDDELNNDFTFIACGFLIYAAILIMFVYSIILGSPGEDIVRYPRWSWVVKYPPVLILEMVALIAFGMAWFTKAGGRSTIKSKSKELMDMVMK